MPNYFIKLHFLATFQSIFTVNGYSYVCICLQKCTQAAYKLQVSVQYIVHVTTNYSMIYFYLLYKLLLLLHFSVRLLRYILNIEQTSKLFGVVIVITKPFYRVPLESLTPRKYERYELRLMLGVCALADIYNNSVTAPSRCLSPNVCVFYYSLDRWCELGTRRTQYHLTASKIMCQIDGRANS